MNTNLSDTLRSIAGFGLFILITLLLPAGRTQAQILKPGFDIDEYIELLKLTSKNSDLEFGRDMPMPDHFVLQYRSAAMGLDNAWELWINTDSSIAAISLRGSTGNTESWLANFYSAMVPATGYLVLSPADTFHYQLAEHAQAAVHTGWLLGMAYLSKEIVPRIDSCYTQGIRNFYITGHSQGGAIGYLLTSYVYHLQSNGQLPADIRFKTYCSAGPKPGNLHFAYAYETLTQEGWSYNIVNSADWVPEMPFSVQTIHDLNEVNPFQNASLMIRKQKFPKRLAFRIMYNRLTRPAEKAQRNYQKYLGTVMSGQIRKHLHEFSPPVYCSSNDYVRTGASVILNGDTEYIKQFPADKQKIMNQHSFYAYLFLARQLKTVKEEKK